MGSRNRRVGCFSFNNFITNFSFSSKQACLRLEMEGVGTYTLSTDSVELRALFVSFSSIVKDLKPVTDREWQTFATNGDFGPAIRTVGRAEKRLLVAACRELLQLATTGVVAAQQRIDANPKALA